MANAGKVVTWRHGRLHHPYGLQVAADCLQDVIPASQLPEAVNYSAWSLMRTAPSKKVYGGTYEAGGSRLKLSKL